VDVSHLTNEFGIVPIMKAKPMRYQLDSRNALPLVLFAGEETSNVTQRWSPKSQPRFRYIGNP